jgi:peptide deformylase
MVYPIVAYGNPVLKKRAKEIDKNYPGLEQLISDMFETMYFSQGVGLAAPQINYSIRLFVTDGKPFTDDDPKMLEFKKVFINPVMIKEEGDEWKFNEGCLSIPGIREDVDRKEIVHLKYLDENFTEHDEYFEGVAARIIQHEYDHLEGILFIDHLTAFKKRLLKGKLNDISAGKVDVDYKMKFAAKK